MTTFTVPSIRRLFVAALVLTGIAGLCALRAPAARANPSQISILMDDDKMLYSGDRIRDKSLDKAKRLGVDVIRATLLWSVVAHRVRHTRRFNGANPKSYPKANWDRYDHLIENARRRGLDVYLNVTGPGPVWAHGKTRDKKIIDSFMPNVAEFKKFVIAAGRRYSGRYHDENDHGFLLPRINTWSLFNEPDQSAWLAPQTIKKGKRLIPYAPILYRRLYWAGRAGLKASGHDRDKIMIGETAPTGYAPKTPRSAMLPAVFIREMFCVNRALRPYRGQAARDRACGEIKRNGGFRTSMWAHHPYTKTRSPTQRDPKKDAITLANINALPRLLDALARRTHLIRPRLPVILTEFGYETNPPDPFVGVPLDIQASWINQGDEIAFHNRRIIGNAQFLLQDVKPVPGFGARDKRHWFTYQSGLYTSKAKAKPALAAYAFPFDIHHARGHRLEFWGQLRFRPNFQNLRKADTVTLQYRKPGSPRWLPVFSRRVTNPFGFFDIVSKNLGAGGYRMAWINKKSFPFVSYTRQIFVKR